MATNRRIPPPERLGQEKLLERIAKRYEQLDEKLREIELLFPEGDDPPAAQPVHPRKPKKPR
jgi:hypothetical protein